MRFPNISRLFPDRRIPPSEQERQETSYRKEYAIHNTESERGFQHSTVFVDIEFQTMDTTPDTKHAEGNATGERVVYDMTAVGFGDTAEFVYASNECAHEAEVDKGHKVGIGTRTVVCEEGCNSPDSGKDGDNKEDEDVVWRQSVI